MRLRDRTSLLFGGLAVATATLVIGSAFRWTQAIVAGLVALALAPQIVSRRVLDRLSPLVLVLGLALVLTVFQLLPLPAGLLQAIDPTGYDLREAGAALTNTDPWRAITLDAPGTLAALGYFLTLLGVAIVALRMSASERGRFIVLCAVGGVCAVSAFVVAIHAMLGMESLFGLYSPHVTPSLLGPLINPNHLGGLMAMGAVVSIGLMMYRKQPSWLRVVWVVSMLGCATCTLATLSRGATIGLAVGALATLGALVGQKLANTDASRRRRSRFLTTSLPVGIVATCTILVVLLSSSGGSNVNTQLARTSLQEISQPTSKYAAWKSSMTLVRETPWAGVGRGAFEPTFTRVHPASGFATFSHVENEYVQTVVDFGIPGAIALGLGMCWLAVMVVRRWRDGPLAAGAIGALVVIGLQSNFDFGVELLGLAIPITAVAATMAYVPLREADGRRLAFARGLRIVHVVAVLVMALVLTNELSTSLDEDRATIVDRGRELELPEVEAIITRHPLDYFGYAKLASMLGNQQDQRAVRILNHAMFLHPTHPGLHRMGGQLLLGAGLVDQAAIEYSAALRATVEPEKLLEEIVQRFPKEKVALAIPTDFVRIDLVINALRDMDRSDIATLWLTRLLTTHSKNVRACEQLYTIALRDNNLDAAELAGRSCVEMVPDRTTRLSLARVLYQKRNYVEVTKLLGDVENWPGRIEDKVNGWLILCDATEGLGKLEDTKRCLRQLDLSGYLDDIRRKEVLKRLERIERRRRDAALGVPQLLEKSGIKYDNGPPPPADGSGSGAGSGSSGSGAKPVPPQPPPSKPGAKIGGSNAPGSGSSSAVMARPKTSVVFVP